MKITHSLPFAAYVALLGVDVEPGEAVEVTDEQAAILLENGAFTEVKAHLTGVPGTVIRTKNTTTGKDA